MILAVVMSCERARANELAQAPPPGVDFSGRWKLNVADSDDPLRLLQVANVPARRIRRRRTTRPSGGRGGRGRGAAGYPAARCGPVMPSVRALAKALRWPGKQLEIKQVSGVVAFTSEGSSRVCQPDG